MHGYTRVLSSYRCFFTGSFDNVGISLYNKRKAGVNECLLYGEIMERKRQFELVSAIIGIILGAFIAISGLLACAAPDILLELVDPAVIEGSGITYDALKATFVGVGVFFILVGMGEVVVCALLCSGKFPNARKALGIVSCIILGVIFVLYLISGGLAIMFALGAGVALAFEIVSLSTVNKSGGAKVTAYYYPDGTVREARDASSHTTIRVIDPFDETQPAPGKTANNPDSVDAKLADLKKLHDEGVLTDEQYLAAADRVVKSALGIGDDKSEVKEVDAEFPVDRDDKRD